MKLKLRININSAAKVEQEIIEKSNNDYMEQESFKNECSLISNNLFVSNYKTACNKDYLMNNSITHILNSAAKSSSYTPVFFEEICYLALHVKDDPSYDLFSVFYKCIEFLENCTKNGTKVLIHCYEVKFKTNLLGSFSRSCDRYMLLNVEE